MLDLNSHLENRLKTTEQENLWRHLKPKQPGQNLLLKRGNQTLINFCSNDYLGLSQHPKVVEAMIKGIKTYGVGSGSAQTISGHTEAHAELEKNLAKFLGAPAVRLFSTGYMANLGIITTLVKRHDAVFQDRQNHASLIDAIHHSQATSHRYRHLDYDHLAHLLSLDHHPQQRRWIVTDTVFSMEGALVDLTKLKKLSDEHNAHVIIDDAHGFGIVGPEGRGSLAQAGLNFKDITAVNVTFGKSLGTFGACIAGSQTIVDTLTQYARPFLYTTAMPPALASATLASLRCLQEEPAHIKNLDKNLQYFIKNAAMLNLPLKPSTTPIQCLKVGDPYQAIQYSNQLAEKGLFIKAIRSPTVPKNQACLRITLTALHETKHLDQLLSACNEIFNTQ